jgi:hypothetical protein
MAKISIVANPQGLASVFPAVSAISTNPSFSIFMPTLLHCCVRQNSPSELLYTMRVKTTWYLSKLGPTVSNHVHEFVHNIFKETEVLLSERWMTFQATGSIT